MTITSEEFYMIYDQFRERLEQEIERGNQELDALRDNYVDLYFQALSNKGINKAKNDKEVIAARIAAKKQEQRVNMMDDINLKTKQWIQKAKNDQKILARLIEDISRAY